MSEGLNLWEFVHCSICFRLWSDGPTIPFWATGCGHIVCNDHLNSNRSCAACGTHDIEVLLLKNDLSEPISHWFRPLSHTQHSAILASRFQIDMMASLLRHYQRESQRQRHIIGKLRRLVDTTRDSREDTIHARGGESEIAAHIPVDSSKPISNYSEYTMNSNGKRHLVGNQPASSTMSFRSVPTPAPPARLTLPSSRPPPTLTGNLHSSTPALLGTHHDDNRPTHPSAANLRQYAYNTQQPTDMTPRNGDYGINMSKHAHTYSEPQQDFDPALHGQSLSHSVPSPQRARLAKPPQIPGPGERFAITPGPHRHSHPVTGIGIATTHSGSFAPTPRHAKDNPALYATDQAQFMRPPQPPEASTAKTRRIFASTPSVRPYTAQSSHNHVNQARFRPVTAARTPARHRAT